MASIFDVKALLKERRQMSVKDVSYHFRIPEGLAEMMLERLADKGVAKLMPVLPSGCGLQPLHGPGKPRLSMVRARLIFPIRVSTA